MRKARKIRIQIKHKGPALFILEIPIDKWENIALGTIKEFSRGRAYLHAVTLSHEENIVRETWKFIDLPN